MKRLLLVSYYYPPLTGSGVFRPLRFSKYLPRHDWDVTVLTVTPRVRVLKDPGLSREVPDGVRIERTRTVELRTLLLALNKLGLRGLSATLQRWSMIPDGQRGWVPFAVRRGERVLKRGRHDAMLTTSAPYSTHLVGRALRRRCGLPWVADLRDEWSLHPDLLELYPTRWHLALNQRLERAVLREAQAVLAVSDPFLRGHRSLVPEIPQAKFHVMTNGYDGEHFRGPSPPPDRFRIVYTGVFYGSREAQAFLEGLRRALHDGRVESRDTEVLFLGHGNSARPWSGLPDGMLRTAGHRPYFEVVETLRRAAVLLLVAAANRGPGLYPGKLFPYLAAGRPILALVPEDGVTAELIRRTGSGAVVAPHDADGVAAALGRLYLEWKSGSPWQPDRSRIRDYDADVQAGRLAGLLDSLVA